MSRSLLTAVAMTLATATLTLTGCTKKKDVQNRVDPNFYVSKSDFEGHTFQLVRGIEEADSNNDIGAVPGFSEDLGLVKVRITENELQFISAFDPVNREATMSIMASYPIIKHFDVIREKNDYNEDTNHIVEDTQQPWNKRKFMRVDWTKPANRLAKLGSLGRLTSSALSDDDSSDSGLTEENTTLLEDPKMEKSHISWLVESNFKGNGSVTYVYPFGYEQASEARVTYRVHLIEAKNTDFKPSAYSLHDFATFGYFTTQQNFEDPEKGFMERDIKSYAHLYNVCESTQKLSCATNKITWVLSKGFPDHYLELTQKAVNQWNEAFKEALNRTDDVVVLDTKTRVEFSDPTHNVIAYYAPKANGGLLGVAQNVDDPRTGETSAARATIYEDGINYVRGEIDDFLDLVERDPEAAKSIVGQTQVPLSSLKDLSLNDFNDTDSHAAPQAPVTIQGAGTINGSTTTDGRAAGSAAQAVTGANRIKAENVLGGMSRMGLEMRRAQMVAKARTMSANPNRAMGAGLVMRPSDRIKSKLRTNVAKLRGNATQSRLRKQSLMAKHPELFANNEFDRISSILNQDAQGFMFQVPEVNLTGRTSSRATSMANGPLAEVFKATHGLAGLALGDEALRAQKVIALHQSAAGVHSSEFVEEATLRYLAKLARKHANVRDLLALREQIKTDISDSTFYTTLLHEMGHTFGLRHNFIGSADNLHYTPEYYALKKKMDAGDTSITNDDLAPYAYSSIMDYGADFFSQDAGLGPYDKAAIRYGYNRSIDRKTDATAKAGFLFCTDHQLNEDIRCRQFDRGATVSEITLNEINRFENNWVLSHLRRGRATYEGSVANYPMYALNRMTKIRMVMDEYVYQLNMSGMTPSDAKTCDLDYIRNSVNAGEMGNICDGDADDKMGVSADDASTYVNALVDPDTHQLRKKITDLKPGGFADLLFANNEALKFFRRVIGNPEPGVFLATQAKVDEPYRLKRLASGSDDEINAIAKNQTGMEWSAFAAQAKQNVTRIPLGRVGHPFYTSSSNEGGVTKFASIGSFIDKYVALLALARNTVGVDKYIEASLSGSAYQFDQSAPAVGDLVTSMITMSREVTTATVRLANGNAVRAYLPASMDQDTQVNAMVTGLTDLVSDLDPTMLERLRVCTENEQGCLPTFGPAVEFVSASGQRRYRASQTQNGDSIAYQLVSRAAAFDQKRQALIKEDADKNADAIADLTNKIGAQETVIRQIRSVMTATQAQ